MLFEAAGTITADALVYSSADSSGRAVVSVADDDSSRAAAEGSLWVALHAAVAGQQVRCASYRILSNVNASSGAVGGAVYLSDDGGWSHAAGTYRRRIGTFLDNSATLGVVELAPQASFGSETLGGIFFSAEITGNASPVSTAHGLGRVPSVAFVVYTDVAVGATTHTAGTHTSTNCIFTVDDTATKYHIIAF
tara:strand:+ start:3983 stop:4561 length:579 start_codon:yes stop_codon:yes gene_type:complete